MRKEDFFLEKQEKMFPINDEINSVFDENKIIQNLSNIFMEVDNIELVENKFSSEISIDLAEISKEYQKIGGLENEVYSHFVLNTSTNKFESTVGKDPEFIRNAIKEGKLSVPDHDNKIIFISKKSGITDTHTKVGDDTYTYQIMTEEQEAALLEKWEAFFELQLAQTRKEDIKKEETKKDENIHSKLNDPSKTNKSSVVVDPAVAGKLILEDIKRREFSAKLTISSKMDKRAEEEKILKEEMNKDLLKSFIKTKELNKNIVQSEILNNELVGKPLKCTSKIIASAGLWKTN